MANVCGQDAPSEASPIRQNHVNENLKMDTDISRQTFWNYRAREKKRTKKWSNRWPSYNGLPSSRTSHYRDTIATSNPWQGYYWRNPHLNEYPMEGREEQRWRQKRSVQDRYSYHLTYGRDNFTNSRQSYGFRRHGNAHYSTGHDVGNYVEREGSWTSWTRRGSGYDRQPQHWSNHSDICYRSIPAEHRGWVSCVVKSGVQRYRYAARDKPRTYNRKVIVASPLRTVENVEPAAASFCMPLAQDLESKPVFKKNELVEKMGLVSPSESPPLEQIMEKIEKLKHKAKQGIEMTSIYGRTTMERAPTTCSRRKLLILDVNGLLADIVFPPPKVDKADINICRRAIFRRPFVNDFLKFCFESFEVGIWSSRTRKILDRVVDYLLGDMRSNLLFCWDESHCTKTGFKTLQNKHKELVFKEMKKVWNEHEADLPWDDGNYDESNTLLLDDSPYKALLNPMHTAIFPHSYSYKNESDNSLGPEGDLRVYLRDLAAAENVKKYVEEHPFGQRPIDEASSSWAYYLEVISSQSLAHT